MKKCRRSWKLAPLRLARFWTRLNPTRVELVTFGLGKSGGRRAWLPVSVQNQTDFFVLSVRRGDVSNRHFHDVAMVELDAQHLAHLRGRVHATAADVLF